MRSLLLETLLLLTISTFMLEGGEDNFPKSWIESANKGPTDFPLQNLPYGVFNPKNSKENPRIGVAIGDYILDLRGCVEEHLFDELSADLLLALQSQHLNALMKIEDEKLFLLRAKITELLDKHSFVVQNNPVLKKKLLFLQADVNQLMPIEISNYTDFYASMHHAMHVGSLMRPQNPLMPNYKHMPIGYHGRSSSIIINGTAVVWPYGQFLNDQGNPQFGLCNLLDYELEMGIVIGKGNNLGSPIKLQDAKEHIFGFVLLNDWSARDIQKWEYQPLGPFNGKNFATTISPWVVTKEALKPFEVKTIARGENDPPLLDYLDSKNLTTFDIYVEAYISSEKMREANIEPLLICKSNVKDLYWTFDHTICHHTSSGCNLMTGDLLGSGTISGPTEDSLGCLLERIVFNQLLSLPDGTTRKYLENGDEIILRGYAKKEGYPRIGFGECRGVVLKSKQID